MEEDKPKLKGHPNRWGSVNEFVAQDEKDKFEATKARKEGI